MGARRYHDDRVGLLDDAEDDGYDPDDYCEGGLMRSSSFALARPHISSRVAAKVYWYEEETDRRGSSRPPVLSHVCR